MAGGLNRSIATRINKQAGASIASTSYDPGSAQTIPLQSFAPDLNQMTPGILTDMDSAVPIMKGFRPRYTDIAYAPALPNRVNTSVIARYQDGSEAIIAAVPDPQGLTTTFWFLQGNGTWANVGGPVSSGGPWRFAMFQNDVIAVAPGTLPLYETGYGGHFIPLPGDPPLNAQVVTVNFGQTFMFQGPNWFTSAAGTDDNWTTAVQNLAGNGQLYDITGPVTAAVPYYQTVIVFKEYGIWSGSEIGPPDIMSWQLISQYAGVRNQEAIVNLGDRLVFLGPDDFYMCQGYTPQPIPNPLKEWFFKTADKQFLDHAVGWYDPDFGVVYWHFVSADAPRTDVLNRYVNWHVASNRWGTGYMQLTAVPKRSMPETSRIRPTKSLYFDATNTLQNMAGPAGSMRLRSWYIGAEGYITQLQRVRASFTTPPTREQVQVYSAYRSGEQEALTSAIVGSDGWHNFRASNRYHRVELLTQGECEVQAAAAEGRLVGVR